MTTKNKTKYTKGQRLVFKKAFLRKAWDYFVKDSKEGQSEEGELYNKIIKVIIYLLSNTKVEEIDKSLLSSLMTKTLFVEKSSSSLFIEIDAVCEKYCLLKVKKINSNETSLVLLPEQVKLVFNKTKEVKKLTSAQCGFIMGYELENGGKEYLDEVFPLTPELTYKDLKMTKSPKIGNKGPGGYTKKSA